MRRRFTALSLILLVTGAAAFFWRNEVVEYVLQSSLSAHGITSVQLQVAEVSFQKVIIRNAHLTGQELDIPDLEMRFSPGGLISGRIDELVLRDARIGTRALTDPGSPLRSWSAAGEGGFEIGIVRIEDGRLDLVRPSKGFILVNGQVDLSAGTARADTEFATGRSKARIAFRADGLSPGAELEVDGSGVVYPSDIVAAGEAISGRVGFSLKGGVGLPEIGGDGESALPATLDLTGSIEASDLSWPSGPSNATASFDWTLNRDGKVIKLGLAGPAHISGRLPAGILAALGLETGRTNENDFAATISEGANLLRWQVDGDGGRAEIAGRLDLAASNSSATAHVDLDIRHDRNGRLREPARIGLAIEAGSVPLQLGEFRGRIARLESHLQGHIGSDEIALAGPTSLQMDKISGPEVLAEKLSLESMLDLAGTPRSWTASISQTGRAEIEGLQMPGRLELNNPLVLTLDEASFSWSGGENVLALGGSLQGIGGAVLTAGAQSLAFVDASGSARLELRGGNNLSGTLTLSQAGVSWPAEALRLSEADLVLPLGAGSPGRRVTFAGTVNDTQSPARLAPLRFKTAGTRTGQQISLSGTLSATGKSASLPLEASADLGAPSAEVKVGPGTLSFHENLLQPRDLLGVFAALEHASGDIETTVSAKILPDTGLRTSARLTFGDFSAASGDLAVSGVAGTLELSDLFPIKSNGEQTLSARSLVAGASVAAPVVKFTIEAGKTLPRLMVHQGRGTIAGGTVSVGETSWDFAADTNALRILVRNLDVQTLLREWRVGGISGSGTLSGTIPIFVSTSGVSIRGGHLEAAGPGVIRVDWGSARDRLMQSGDQVALAVKALESFEYQALTIDIDKPAGGEVSCAIGLDGVNPSVLAGRPFRFNITLHGRLEPILSALREGRLIGGDLFGGGFGPSKR